MSSLEWNSSLPEDASPFDLLPGADFKRKLRESRDKIKSRMSAPSVVKLRDKLAFVFGVCNLWGMAYLLGRHPNLYPTFYSIEVVLLVFMRFISYRRSKFHYFLFDLLRFGGQGLLGELLVCMCYFANALCLLYMWVLPTSRILFIVCFTLSNGPIIWAIVAWRNSMVFHSLDKITSVFIHLGPPMAMSTLRHVYHPTVMTFCTAGAGGCPAAMWELMVYPLVAYIVWQIMYYVLVVVLRAQRIKQRQYVTSISYLLEDDPKSLMGRICCRFAPERRVFAFMAVQLLYTSLTFLPAKLFWDTDWVNWAFVGFMTVWSIWNGANFYMEVFAKHYLEKFESKKEGDCGAAPPTPAATSTATPSGTPGGTDTSST